VKAMIVALVKVGNANTTCVILEIIDVARSYFLGILLRSSIKVSIYLFKFLIFQALINNLRFDFLISSCFKNKIYFKINLCYCIIRYQLCDISINV
jgi:hypothetical protein